MFDLVIDSLELFLDFKYLLVNDFRVEFGYFADRLLHEFEDILLRDFPEQLVLVFLHLGEDVSHLGLPALLVLFQEFVNPVLEEDLLQ